MMTMRSAMLLVPLLASAVAAGAQQGTGRVEGPGPAASITARAHIPQCQVFLIHDVPVPAMETGSIVVMSVVEGEQVRQGQLLARIDDRRSQYDKLAAELKRNAAQAKAQDDIEVRFAQASVGVADAELAQSEEINRRSPGTVSAAELRRLQLTSQRAKLQIDRSRLEQQIAGITAEVEMTAVAAAEDKIQRCQIVAPFDGLVLDILHHAAEWVDAGEPVVRMIRLDRLRVEGFLDVKQFNPEEIMNRSVSVEIQRARGQKVQLSGQVVYISPLVQAGDRYRVRAEVVNRQQDNHWLLSPGMSASMTIHTSAPAGSASGEIASGTRR